MPSKKHTVKEDENFFKHPVFHPLELQIDTKAIHELKENITRLVWTGATGAAILGFTRAGKSTALNMIEKSIVDRSGKTLPVVCYKVPKRDKNHIRTLAANICRSLRLKFKQRDSAEDLIEIITIHLAERARAASTDRIILTIDEAQRLAISQIDLFSELYDTMRDEFGVQLTIFFVGNSEQVGRLLDKIRDGEHEHIEGRFFRNSFGFHGIITRSDVEYCLGQYDKLRYPEDGQCYTQYFLPEAYENGFRLKSLSTSIWRVYRRYQKALKNKEWAMEYFTRAVNALLTDYLHRYGADEYSDEMFEQCIEISGLVPSQVISEAA